jgi:beta-lactamase regulating signal transducer with metallopeptidase domain
MILSSSIPGILVDSAARSLLLAAVVAAGLALSRTRNVVAQKAAWTLVLAAALLMPALAPWAGRIPGLPRVAAIPVPRGSWLANSATDAGQGGSELKQSPASARVYVSHKDAAIPAAEGASLGRFPAPAIGSGVTAAQSVAPIEKPARSLQIADVLLLLYLSVCAALVVRLGMGIAAAIRLWNTAEPVSHPAIPRGMRVRASDGLASPVTVGSGIVLPANFADWDEEKLQIVLAHEASHVQQGDFYLQLCAALYTALVWFSPLGWLLKRKLSDLSETISDRAAVDRAASHATYAQVLLEFAALPRPIATGVAMANHRHVISRIERLLNESSFRQAFAGGRARIAAAVLLVPIALYAATVLVRVEAAQTAPPAPAAAPAVTGPAAPAIPADAVSAPAAPAPEAPVIAGTPAVAPVPAVQAEPAPAAAPAPPAAPGEPAIAPPAPAAQDAPRGSHRHGYSYSFNNDGESYAVISGNDNVTFSGDWYDGRKAEIDKARKMAHGDFLWFTRDGKSYMMDDPQVVSQIKQMYAPMEALGEQQRKLGEQQRELGEKQRAMGEKQRQVSVPTPEMSEAIAQVEAAAATLRSAKGKPITEEKLADMQSKLADLQGKLGELQGQVGEKQGEIGEQQGELGEQQGKLGEQQGQLGEEQGRLAQEADKKVKSIIDESLKNGKARPVQ